jgi:hypothetical protein
VGFGEPDPLGGGVEGGGEGEEDEDEGAHGISDCGFRIADWDRIAGLTGLTGF